MSFFDDASLVFLPSGQAGKDGKAYSMKPVEELGSELVTNGDFTNGSSNWSTYTSGSSNVVFSDDVATINIDGSNSNVGIYQENVFSSGVQYRIVLRAKGTSSFDAEVVESQAAATQQVISSFSLTTSYQDFVFTHTANGTNDIFIHRLFSASGANESIIIDNVSIKEITTPLADFTFSRGSNLTATRVDSNGLIEKGRENLLENSVWDGVTTDTRPTGWAAQFVSGTGTFDVTATEGQIRFQTLDASSRAFIYSPTITTNGIVVASVYVDEVTTAMPLSDLLSRSGSATFLFAYEDGVEINYSDNVQAGKRYSVVFNKTASTTFRFGVGTSSGTLGDVVLSKPQIEIGLVATEWITSPVGSKGLAGILEDSPRFDYSGGASCPSLLLEGSRTNLFEQSEYYEDTFWEAASAGEGSAPIVTTNYATSPEGVKNATRIQFNASSTGDSQDRSRIRTTVTIPTDNVDYTQSFYIKSNNGTEQKISFLMDNSQQEIMTVTSEWQRFDATRQHTGATGIYGLDLRSNFASTSDILVYAGQLEEGSYPTSYIPNHSGGSVTREADVCEGAGTSSTFNDAEGVLYLEASAIDNGSSEKAIAINDGTTNNRINIRIVNNTIKGLVIIGGSLVCNISYTAPSVITSNKIALKYKENDFALWVNGIEVGTDTSGSIFTAGTLNELSFDYGGASAFFYGNVEQVLYFPTALSAPELTALTS